MSRALVTITCGDFFERMAAITHPTMAAYARKIGAEFIVWRDFPGHTMPHYRKLEIGKLLDQYDRVLYLDTDILVREDTPDLFDSVPENELGMLEVGQYVDRKIDVIQFMIAVGYDARGWDGKYYNSGVIVLSKQHQNLFVQPPTEYDHFKEQTYLNLMISRTKTKVFPLSHRFNRTYFMDWIYGEERCDCYLIHYAGVNVFASESEQLDTMASDRAVWERSKPHYHFPKHVVFVVQGDLREQVVAEPAVRYAKDVLYQGDQLAIVSEHPELFIHLGLPVHAKLADVPQVKRYQPRFSRVNTSHRASQCMDPRQVHGVDLASLNLLGITLPMAYKRPTFRVDSGVLAAVRERVGGRDLSQLVVLHLGPGSAGVTVPREVWRSYASILIEHGYQLAVIGHEVEDGHEVAKVDASHCIDLRDRLTVSQLIALLSQTPVLVSDDSAAVQIAGAVDAWIGLIATTRHPEYVLAWRNGSQFFKARQLERTALYNRARKTASLEPESIVNCTPADVRRCLAEPAAILQFVREALPNAAS